VLFFFFLVLVSSFRLVLSHGSRFEVSLFAEEQPAHGAAAAAPGGRLQAVTVLGSPQPVGQVLRESSILIPLSSFDAHAGCLMECLIRKVLVLAGRQVYPRQVGDGHGHGALPADGAEEGHGEACGVPSQGGLPEAAQQPHQDPGFSEQAARAREHPHGSPC
jgi:hypothetical protein